ncbi:MAG: PilZ domain-containing protein [Bryobacteraceae bacterium]
MIGTTSTTPSWSALKRKDLRKHRRYAVADTTLKVSWLDQGGQLKMAYAKVLNVSEGGMAFELPEAPLATSMVRFQSEKHKVVGQAAVRHFRKVMTKWVVGVEFADGLRWMPPPEPVAEPIPLFDPELLNNHRH